MNTHNTLGCFLKLSVGSIIFFSDAQAVKILPELSSDKSLGSISKKNIADDEDRNPLITRSLVVTAPDHFSDEYISQFKNLRSLTLIGDHYTDEAIRDMPHLTYLEIRGCLFTDAATSNKRNLESLIIEAPQMTNASVINLRSLRQMELEGPNFTEEASFDKPHLRRCVINKREVILK